MLDRYVEMKSNGIGIVSLVRMREGRLRWFGHVEYKDNNDCIKCCTVKLTYSHSVYCHTISNLRSASAENNAKKFYPI